MLEADISHLRESNFENGYIGYTIYALINLENGKRYIGRTNHPRKRLKAHFSMLKHHRHPNPFLNKDSICPFGFEILEDGVPYDREKELIYKFKTYDADYGYNVSDPCTKPLTKSQKFEDQEVVGTVGQKIKARRKKLGLSQKELAMLLGCKSKSSVCKIERGEDNLTISLIKRYADALECTAASLLEGI